MWWETKRDQRKRALGGMKGRVRRVKDLQMAPDPRRNRTDVNACRFNPNYRVSPPCSLLPSPIRFNILCLYGVCHFMLHLCGRREGRRRTTACLSHTEMSSLF